MELSEKYELSPKFKIPRDYLKEWVNHHYVSRDDVIEYDKFVFDLLDRMSARFPEAGREAVYEAQTGSEKVGVLKELQPLYKVNKYIEAEDLVSFVEEFFFNLHYPRPDDEEVKGLYSWLRSVLPETVNSYYYASYRVTI